MHYYALEEAVQEEVVILGSCLSDKETWKLRTTFISSLEDGGAQASLMVPPPRTFEAEIGDL